MVADPLEEALQRFYPGSTTPIPEPGKEEPQKRSRPELGAWDEKPQVFLVNGKEVEFFTIGALGQAMNKSPVTLREWERKGWIPQARFRTSAGARRGAKRLYTRLQIEGMVIIAEQEGLLRPKPRDIPRTQFTPRVVRLFQALENQATGTPPASQ